MTPSFPNLDGLEAYLAFGKDRVLELKDTIDTSQIPVWRLFGAGVVLYLSLVELLRFRSLRKQTKTYAAYVKDPYKLDYKTAHPIMKRVMLYEAPWMYAFSTQYEAALYSCLFPS